MQSKRKCEVNESGLRKKTQMVAMAANNASPCRETGIEREKNRVVLHDVKMAFWQV